ncbi:MAG: phytanoyl-CoA dioxygenase family protein [Pseudomonadales bacterium]
MEYLGATSGWDEATPPNETVDADGNPIHGEWGFTVPDSGCPSRRRYDDPEVVALRERLARRNGLAGLEICAPDEFDRAARIFHRDGFVVVRDLLDAGRRARLQQGCDRALETLLSVPGKGGRRYAGETGRLPHRYSFGTCSASRQMLHDPAWAALLELPDLAPLLAALFGADDFLVWGCGGDVCLPGAMEYQHLHSDFQEDFGLPAERLALARAVAGDRAQGTALDGAHLDGAAQRLALELTPPMITVNFVLTELTRENGPIRHIPGSHGIGQAPPRPEHEPAWMRESTLVGALPGAAVFRDNRAWHGGTPNLSREARALPNVEYVAPWYPADRFVRTMPHERWLRLGYEARRRCREVVLDPDAALPGGGRLHPLLAQRRKLRDAPNRAIAC